MQTHWFTRDVPMSDIDTVGSMLPGVNKGNAIPKFYQATTRDNGKSDALGRFVSKSVDMIRIIIPGDKHNIVERRVQEDDKKRWQKQWDAYKKMIDFVPEGTLLDTWPMLSRAQVEDLKYNNIFTVEALAGLSDEQLTSVGLGARMLRKHAQAFIEASRTGAPSAALVAENEKQATLIAALTQQVEALTKQMELLAKKAGEKIEDMSNPINEAKATVAAAAELAPKLDIPANYKMLGLPALRALCAKFSDIKVLDKETAFELIAEYQAQA